MAGVMFTKTGHSGAYSGCVEIGTKKGLGIRVVEGHAEPELTFYCGEGRISSVNPSKDDKMLHFGENGGVIETGTAPGGFLLSKDMISRLAEAGLEIEKKIQRDSAGYRMAGDREHHLYSAGAALRSFTQIKVTHNLTKR